MLEDATSEWQEYCVNITSHNLDSVRVHIYGAMKQLIAEKKKRSACRAALLLSELESNSFLYENEAVRLTEEVLDVYPNSLMARCQLAGLLIATDFDRSIRLIEDITPEDIENLSDINDRISAYYLTAIIKFQANEYAESFYLFSQISRMNAEEMSDYEVVGYVKALLSYSTFLHLWGDWDAELSVFSKCYDVLKKRKLYRSNASANILAKAAKAELIMGKTDEALESACQAMDQTSEALRLFSPSGLNAIRVFSTVLYHAGEHEQSIEMLENIKDAYDSVLGEGSTPAYLILSDLTDLYLRNGNYGKACDVAEEVTKMVHNDARSQAVAYSNFAGALRVDSQYEKSAEVSVAAIEKLRQYIHSAFTSLSDSGREHFWRLEGYNILRNTLYAADTPADKHGSVYNLALLSKGILVESDYQFFQSVVNDIDDDAFQTFLKYKQHQWELEEEYCSSSPDSLRIRQLRDAVQQEGTHLMYQTRPEMDKLFWFNTTWEDVARNLRKDEVAVEYLKYKHPRTASEVYLASVLSSDAPPVNVTLPGIDESSLINASPDSLYRTSLLYDLFIKPIEPLLKNKRRIYFSPTSGMSSLALESVVSAYEMIRVSSTRQITREHIATKWDSAVLYGGLDYNMGMDEMEYYAERAMSRGADDNLHNWRFLRGTLEEVKAIDGILGGINRKVISGEEGVEENFKALSSACPDIVHVATHGYFDAGAIPKGGTRYQLEEEIAMKVSGLVFAGANNRVKEEGINDGLLSAMEISRMNMTGCKLLVLSACSTGKGHTGMANETFGLMRAFKKAGCESILMSLWEIDDDVTKLFMTTFYKYLLNGKTTAEAISLTRKAICKRYPDPRYWAGFILID